jgi:hypothetical protein
MQDVVQVTGVPGGVLALQLVGELREDFCGGGLLKGDQPLGQQQEADLGAQQMQWAVGKAEAMPYHQQGVIEHINPGPLRDLEDGWKQQFGHLQGLRHAADARAIGKAHDPQPLGTPRLDELPQVLRRFQWNQPWASRLEQHGAEQGGAAPPMDEQLAGQTRRSFLKASRTQSTWGRLQHGGESASQCCKSHPVETMPL